MKRNVEPRRALHNLTVEKALHRIRPSQDLHPIAKIMRECREEDLGHRSAVQLSAAMSNESTTFVEARTMIQSIGSDEVADRRDTAQQMIGFAIAICEIDLRAWLVQRFAFKDLG